MPSGDDEPEDPEKPADPRPDLKSSSQETFAFGGNLKTQMTETKNVELDEEENFLGKK